MILMRSGPLDKVMDGLLGGVTGVRLALIVPVPGVEASSSTPWMRATIMLNEFCPKKPKKIKRTPPSVGPISSVFWD